MSEKGYEPCLQMPDTFLPIIFLSRLYLFPRLVNVHLPVLTQKVFILKSYEPGFVLETGIIANCLGKFQLFGQNQLEYPLASNSCFLGIMLMLHPVYTLILATMISVSIRKWKPFLFLMLMILLLTLLVYTASVYAFAYAYVTAVNQA